MNDQTLPAVLPPLDTAVTRQKYVVDGDSVTGTYDEALSPLATCGGGLVVPNATLNVVPTAPADHPSVGVVPTPAAAFEGVGFAGAAGGPAMPAVVKPQSDEAATSEGLTAVALVREMTLQT